MVDTDCVVDDGGARRTVLQVERGRATDAELAAVTVVLFSLLAAQADDTDAGPAPDVPQWRPERAPDAYRSPYHWR